ncbi:hypothetical protein [Heliophilum fasciatum]|uniref:hypothetical protein n=1 Tax=Heliophilum fasciatum TaxID=35700 RepID=UPI001A9AF03E|nr:hypothetical protein [Heliophilum fasciatum]
MVVTVGEERMALLLSRQKVGHQYTELPDWPPVLCKKNIKISLVNSGSGAV